MEILLSDSFYFLDTYNLIQRNSINKLIEDYKKILKRWSQNNYISDYIHSQLKSILIPTNNKTLLIIHKNGYLLRIIALLLEIHYTISLFIYKKYYNQVFLHHVVIMKIVLRS